VLARRETPHIVARGTRVERLATAITAIAERVLNAAGNRLNS